MVRKRLISLEKYVEHIAIIHIYPEAQLLTIPISDAWKLAIIQPIVIFLSCPNFNLGQVEKFC